MSDLLGLFELELERFGVSCFFLVTDRRGVSSRGGGTGRDDVFTDFRAMTKPKQIVCPSYVSSRVRHTHVHTYTHILYSVLG